jgi:hypothetical protein
MKEIPFGSIEVQVGLYAYAKTLTFGGVERRYYDLYSAEGYCFYLPENNLDEDGDLFPENERVYYQYMSTAWQNVLDINANVVSVLVKEGYEIA